MSENTCVLMNSVMSAACPTETGLDLAMAHPRLELNAHRGGIIDVLTIGEEATLLRLVQRALLESGWVVRHAPTVQAAVAIVERTSVAVAVIEAEPQWVEALSFVRSVANPPEVVFVAAEELCMDEVLSAGAHDLLRHPLEAADLLWSLATAWHAWMRDFEQRQIVTAPSTVDTREDI